MLIPLDASVIVAENVTVPAMSAANFVIDLELPSSAMTYVMQAQIHESFGPGTGRTVSATLWGTLAPDVSVGSLLLTTNVSQGGTSGITRVIDTMPTRNLQLQTSNNDSVDHTITVWLLAK